MSEDTGLLRTRYGYFQIGGNASTYLDDTGICSIAGVISIGRDWLFRKTGVVTGHAHETDISRLVRSQPDYPSVLFNGMDAVHFLAEGRALTLVCARFNPWVLVDENMGLLGNAFFRIFRGEDLFYIAAVSDDMGFVIESYLSLIAALDKDKRYEALPKPHFTGALKPFQPTLAVVHNYLLGSL